MKKCIVNFDGKQYIGEIIKEGSMNTEMEF